jgi:hypothetical protein
MANRMYAGLRYVEYAKRKPSGCVEWDGYRMNMGYGELGFKGRKILAHRLSWVLHNGKPADGMEVCHKCDNPACVNPEHLFLGTHADNMRDCHAKGRNGFCHGSKSGMAKTNEAAVLQILRLRSEGAETKELGRMFGLSIGALYQIFRGDTWNRVWKQFHATEV